ncbi:alcohol dehydrogenase [Janibacter sp. YB324]|uniref:alcohol dehydrogenase n=1 Tax=Janibacter sp. YB324 TaxID=2761047 RepID=UPI0016239937|nr:alcohol dehydrogenase [Janibacter sp. YB324]QNF95394.1 alcohol dehydrogenase catalytic domain-containing protein [Janibacter sp. YB324]
MQTYAVVSDASTDMSQIEIPTPEPQGTEVLLRVTHSGVCHTDTHLREGYYDLGARGKMRMVDRGIPYPLVMGHEVVGVVEQVGTQATGVAKGETRLVYPWTGCGECAVCLAGRENACAQGRNIGVARPGGYADHVLVPHPRYLLDIEGVDPSWAATMACSGLTAYSAARKVLPLPEDAPVVVIGVGGVGLTAVATLSALGHRNICAVDMSEDNLAAARELGATTTVVSGSDLVASVTEAVGGPVDAVIDFVNNSQTAPTAFDLLVKGGKMVQVGLFGGDVTIPTALLALKMLRIEGSFVGSLGELEEVVDLAKQGKVPRIPVTEGELDLASVTGTLDRLTRGGVTGRIVLKGAAQ